MSAISSCTHPQQSATSIGHSTSISDDIPGAAPYGPWVTSPPWADQRTPYGVHHGAPTPWQPGLAPAPYQTGQPVEFPGSLPPVPHLPPHGILPAPIPPAPPLDLEEIQRILTEAERLQGSARHTDGARGDAVDASPGAAESSDSGADAWPPPPTSLAEELFDD